MNMAFGQTMRLYISPAAVPQATMKEGLRPTIICANWQYNDETMPPRTGIRIRGQRGDAEVRAAFIRFASWLRAEYRFPIRVPVYLLPGECVPAIDGLESTAAFFAPYSRSDEPIIRVATGEYLQLKRQYGRQRALASRIVSFAHEVVHYFQWLNGSVTEQNVQRQAIAMFRRYERAVTKL
jgi:hypothetical protein